MPEQGGLGRSILDLVRRVARWFTLFLATHRKENFGKREDPEILGYDVTLSENSSGVVETSAPIQPEPSSGANELQASGGFDKDLTVPDDDITLNSPWIKPRLDGAAIDDGNAADERSGPWASGVQPPADRGLPCT